MDNPIKKTDEFGNTFYLLNGKLHRTDGPAIEHISGTKEWWVNGFIHRTDGPAVEDANGYKSWWIDNWRITTENYQRFVNDYPDLINQFLAYQALSE